jgi:threonine dehydratase
MSPTLHDIREAAKRIKPYAHRTLVLTNKSLNQKVGAQVFLKCENLQKVGAFKFRGACNAVYSLSDESAHIHREIMRRRWLSRHGCAASLHTS